MLKIRRKEVIKVNYEKNTVDILEKSVKAVKEQTDILKRQLIEINVHLANLCKVIADLKSESKSKE